MESPDFPERLIEVLEESDVSGLGIQLQSSGLLVEEVNLGISTELKSTRRSIELVLLLIKELRIMLPLRLMLLKRTLLPLEDSLTMVLFKTIS